MKRGWIWPVIIVGLLVAGVGGNIALMLVAHSNASFAVEPDYYQKALDWDQHRAQAATNRNLGWRIELSVDRDGAAPGHALLVAHLLDSEGTPLEGARIGVKTLHLARAADVQELALTEGPAGEYSAPMRLHRPGLWEFRLVVERGEQTFTDLQTLEIALP